MDFNVDDPLGDLLSDGSDDSFFASKPKTTTAQKDVKTTAAPAATKSKMENLFGIKEPTPTSGPNSLGIIKTPTQPRNAVPSEDKPKPAARQIPKKEISFEADDDIFADLGFDPKKPKAGTKKSNILDDLLGLNEPKASTKPPITVKPVTPTANRTSAMSRQSTFDKPNDPLDEPGYAPTNRLKTPTTKRKSDAKISDPLGFFSSSIEPTTKPQTPKPVKKANATADWLGIDTPAQPDSSNVTVEPLPIIQKQTTLTIAPVEKVLQQSNLTQSAPMIASIGSEASLHSLQQHETQLMVAVQMKNQELALIDMQRKQHELLSQQEHNFNELMQKQVQRQTALEQNIQWQQERINSHIQRLMTPTTNSIPVPFQAAPSSDQKTDTVAVTNNPVITEIELKAEVKQLELDKIRLEDVFHSIKTNHDQEIELLEQSHKKQIQLLEENLVNTEQRLRNETINLEAFYTSKVTALIKERDTLICSYDLKISQLEDNYARILGKLKTHHEEEVDDIRKEHRNMIDNIRQSKLMEFALVQDNSSYLDALKSASGYLETASEDLQTIRVDLEAKLERAHKDREIQLEIREKKINDQQKHFEKLRDATETERVALLELVKTLEIKLNSVTQSSEEELWSIRQQRATLDTERTAFEREREFARERIGREEKRLEDLKAYHQMENQHWQQQLQDDRIAVLAEKSKLETLERLQRPIEISTSRAEIDAAVQVAQDAARQSDLERERHIEQQRKFESRRRELIDQENGIRAREMELETAINETKSKGRVADARVRSCTVTEQQLASKLAHLQFQFQELNTRETKLSQDKFELSQERLELQAMRRKMYQSRCSLCKIGDQSQELAELLSKADVPNFRQRKNGEDVDDLLDREVTHGMQNMTEYQAGQTTQSFEGNDMEADLLLARFEAMNKGLLK